MDGAIFLFMLVLNGHVFLPVGSGVRRQVTLTRRFDQLSNLPQTEGGRVPPPLRQVVARHLSTLCGLL